MVCACTDGRTAVRPSMIANVSAMTVLSDELYVLKFERQL